MPKQTTTKRAAKPRARGEPEAWREFSDEQDLRAVLEDADLDIDQLGLDRFRKSLNEEIRNLNVQWILRRQSPPRMRDNGRDLHKLAGDLRGLLYDRPELRVELQRQHDKALGLIGDRVRAPDATLLLAQMLNVIEYTTTTGASRDAVKIICQSVAWLERIGLVIEREQTNRQDADELSLKNILTYHRYDLVLKLSGLFQRTFGLPAPKTLESVWCRFLAGALSHIEGKPLTDRGAHDVWLRASGSPQVRE